jgi:hypothetical protein
VPATCPISRGAGVRLGRELAEFPGGEIADGGSDDALPIFGVMQVDQGRSGAGVAHAGHQFPQAHTGGSGQQVAAMAQVMEMDLG